MYNQNVTYHMYVEMGIYCSKTLEGGRDLSPESALILSYFEVLCK